MSETHLVRRLMLAATERGARLFRNNVGQYTAESGHTVRYGLCPGSSDLIGWTPHTITAADVGRTVAIFTAVEAKTLRGKPTDAQINFVHAVQAAGGYAVIARSTDDLPGALSPDATTDR
jgi:hypothetical protein